MARRIVRAQAPDDRADDAARNRRRAAQLAFVKAGGLGVDILADRWWSRWYDRGVEIWRDGELSRRERDEQHADHHIAALEHMGPDALELFERQLARLERNAELSATPMRRR